MAENLDRTPSTKTSKQSTKQLNRRRIILQGGVGLAGLTTALVAGKAQANTQRPVAPETGRVNSRAKGFVTKRVMSPEEMARAVMFLASNDATSVTGMDLDVTGGQLAR